MKGVFCLGAILACQLILVTRAHGAEFGGLEPRADIPVSYWLAHKDQLRIAQHWCADHDPMAKQQRCQTAFVAYHQWEVDAVLAAARKHSR